MISLVEHQGIFGFGDHLEQVADWADDLIVDIDVNEEGLATEVRYQWGSTLRGRTAEGKLENVLEWEPRVRRPGEHAWTIQIPITEMGCAVLGQDAGVSVLVDPWD